jgi:energy-coupling factor transport system substrate-specific component
MTTVTGKTPTKSRFRYTTRDILTIAVLAAVGGVVGALVVGIWAKFIEGAIGPFGAALNNPFHIFWPVLAALIVRKPGVALVGSMLYGVVEMLAGGLDGSIILVFVLFQGIGAELGMLIFRYRRNLASAMVATALAGVGCAVCILYVFGFSTFDVTGQLLFILALAAGDGIVGGLLAWGIARGVAKTGAFTG